MSRAHRFTRQELFDLVWSQPIRAVATTVGISDVALAKACRKADIPLPERGYWAKHQAGKPTTRPTLPPRFPGALDTVEVGHHQSAWDRESDLLDNPLPAPEEFPEEISALRERITKMVGTVAYPRLASKSHPLIAIVLAQDEERSKESAKYYSPWSAPRYDSVIKKRQLRILNAIFLATQQHGCRPGMSTSKYVEEHGDVTIRVGGQVVTVKLRRIAGKNQGAEKRQSAKERLSISILATTDNTDVQQYWGETETTPIEDSLTDIVIAIITSGELQYRHSVHSQYQWRLHRRAKLEEEARRKKIEVEHMAQELREKRERTRVERLLAAATALQQADTIRNFVAAIRARSSDMFTSTERVERWATWALVQANRIDPTKTLAFLEDIEG